MVHRRLRGSQAFLVSEAKGTWHTAIEVPGIAALNKGSAQVNTLSCASAGNCAAGGSYVANNGVQAFAATEVDGVWRTAIEVLGSAALNVGGYAGSLRCHAARRATAPPVGITKGNSTSCQGFVADEVNGTWHHAIEVPGSADLNKGDYAQVSSVSCGSAGDCSAGRWYTGSADLGQPFVVSEVNGAWHHAEAGINAVSCASASNCGALGSYTDSSKDDQVFVVSKAPAAVRG